MPPANARMRIPLPPGFPCFPEPERGLGQKAIRGQIVPSCVTGAAAGSPSLPPKNSGPRGA
jgi:hypothetical protein